MEPRGEAQLSPGALDALSLPEYRVESRQKVTGKARYTADIQLPDMLWAGFLGSPLPHARIVSIGTSAARAVPGVRAVLTGEDIGRPRLGRRLMDWPVLAWDKVRFVGDRVAAVAAESREAAERAVRAIEVEYEELPTVFEPEEALADGAPILHEDPSGYVFLGGTRPDTPHPNVQSHVLVQKGEPDIEGVFARCAFVFDHTFTTPRQHAGHLEPHAAIVWLDDDGIVHVTSTNKMPFMLREQMSVATSVPVEKIVVDNEYIGGDFGGKGLSLDEFACYYLARETGCPVKAVMAYEDELQATNTRHASTIRLRTGVTADGKLVAHQAEVVFNGGAYAAAKPVPSLTLRGGLSTLGAYSVPNTHIEVKIAYTNTVPGGHNRAPGEVQALFAGESHVDMIARELGIDPLEFRLLNAIREGDTGPATEQFREPRAVEVLEALRRETNWGQKCLPPNGGRGIALGMRHVSEGKGSVILRLLQDGRIEVKTGVSDQGSGSHTVACRIASTVLSVAPERIVVTYGSTGEAPFDPGSGASRVTHVVGHAVRDGAAILKERLEELACEMVGCPPGKVRLKNDLFVVEDSGEAVPFAEVAGRIARGRPVEVLGSYDGSNHGPDEPGDFNFFAYMIEVEVDPETGQLHLHDVVLVADVGTIINPVSHQGQLEGGFVFGLGNALMEELQIKAGKVMTTELGEYKLSTVMDTPPFHTVLLPTPVGSGPLGAKPVGETSNSGVAPAIGNAVTDATGARVFALPITSERVLEALKGSNIDAGDNRDHPDSPYGIM